MADVSISPPDPDRFRGENGFRDAHRGPLLLLAGLVMAVSLVALVVLLNATIYSENVATRGIESADGEALEVRATMVEGTGELIDATNRNATEGYAETEAAVEDGIAALDARVAGGYARRGGVANVTLVENSLREGRFLTGPVDSSTAVTDVDRTRGFVIEIDSDDLETANTSTASDEAFHVVLNRSASGATDEVYVYEDDEEDEYVVATGEDGAEPTVRCRRSSIDGDRVAVDLTDGRFDGDPCPGLWPTERLDPDESYAIEFATADGVDTEVTAPVRSTTDPAGGAALESTPAVYEAAIDVSYRTAELRFETRVRVAPGGPDV